jgi:AcrR family transcriptional regulator
VQAEEKIISSFRQLVATQGFEKVTISEICTNAKTSRKTFYAHFEDKYQLLERVFDIDMINPLEELRAILPTARIKSAPQLLTETIYRNILNSKSFYKSLFGYAGADGSIARDVSMVLLTKEITKMNVAVLDLKDCSVADKEYIAYFFAAAQVALISKWIREKMVLPPDHMAKLFVKCTFAAFNEMHNQSTVW